MVVLGGMASPFGPVFGAVAFLVLEEALPSIITALFHPFVGDQAAHFGEHWQIILGPLLLLVVLFARGGIDGLLRQASLWRADKRREAAMAKEVHTT
jgi:branched-chain amino acid transport system permease protein